MHAMHLQCVVAVGRRSSLEAIAVVLQAQSRTVCLQTMLAKPARAIRAQNLGNLFGQSAEQ